MKKKILIISLVAFIAVIGAVDKSQAIFTEDYKFGTPVNLGPNINSAYIDTHPTLTADGNTLFFTSNRPGGYGGSGDYDIYTATRINGVWLPATNLGSLFNSSMYDQLPVITPDGNRLFFTSSRGTGGNNYSRTWVSEKLNEVWQEPVLLPNTVNVSWANNNSQFVSADGRWLYVSYWAGWDDWNVFRVDITTGNFSITEGSPLNMYRRDFAVYQTMDEKYFVGWAEIPRWLDSPVFRVVAWELVDGVYTNGEYLSSPFIFRFSMAKNESELYSNLNVAGGYGSEDIYVSPRIYNCSEFGISSVSGVEQIINPLPLAGQKITLNVAVTGNSNPSELAWTLSVNGQVVAEGSGIAEGIAWDGRNGDGNIEPGTYNLLLSLNNINGGCVAEKSLNAVLELTDDCKLRATFPTPAMN